MRTITTTVYKFNELSDEAKDNAIENYRNSDKEYFWLDENRETMEKFAKLFPIEVTNWSYGGRGEGVSFTSSMDGAIEELTGQRLATYLWNNYKRDLFKGKYYSKQRATSTPEKYQYVKRYSRIQLENSCVLTGYYMDNEILDPIYQFLDSPRNINFLELLEECFDAWVMACNQEIESQDSDEYIADHLEANNYEFTEEGEIL